MELEANTRCEYPPHLSDYLNKAFPVNEGDDLHHVTGKVISHFWEEYKVHVKPQGDFFLFKYAQSLCDKWHVPGISECRGVILQRGTHSCFGNSELAKKWEYKSRPFNKFFNQNEGASPVRLDKDFNKLVGSFWFFEKGCLSFVSNREADGTCIQLWCDGNDLSQNKTESSDVTWRISTLGKINPDPWVRNVTTITIRFLNCSGNSFRTKRQNY